MSSVLSQEEKQTQFDAFFKVSHSISVNIIPFKAEEVVSFDDFEASMPHAFKLAGQFSSIDDSALRALKLNNSQTETLVSFLDAQARKIDWMLSFILEQQDDPTFRHQTIEFGAGGIVVGMDEPMNIGQLTQIKLFLPTEYSAVFCFGEVIACEVSDNKYHIAFLFTHIRESDQELLIRATLHLQTQQLRARNKSNTPE